MKISELQEILELVKSREGDLNVINVKPGIITNFSFEIRTDTFENITGKTLVVGLNKGTKDLSEVHLCPITDSGLYLIDITTNEDVSNRKIRKRICMKWNKTLDECKNLI